MFQVLAYSSKYPLNCFAAFAHAINFPDKRASSRCHARSKNTRKLQAVMIFFKIGRLATGVRAVLEPQNIVQQKVQVISIGEQPIEKGTMIGCVSYIDGVQSTPDENNTSEQGSPISEQGASTVAELLSGGAKPEEAIQVDFVIEEEKTPLASEDQSVVSASQALKLLSGLTLKSMAAASLSEKLQGQVREFLKSHREISSDKFLSEYANDTSTTIDPT
eukprot:972881_1